MHYNRLIALVMTVNAGWAGYGATAANWWTSDGTDLGAVALVAQTNLAAAVVFRQQYVINALAWLVTRPPTSWPLRIRWTLGKYYHFGGLHVGAALAGTLWYLALVVSMVGDAVAGVGEASCAHMVLGATIATTFALLPTVIAVAAALILGGMGVAIALLVQQNGELQTSPPQVTGPDKTGRDQPAADGDAPFRGFVLRQLSIEVRGEPVLSAPVTGYLPYETEVFIVCTSIGDVVEGPGAGGGPSIATPVWDKVRTAVHGADLGFVPDAWVKTGTAQPQAGSC
jgi:hypothetical protein